MFLRQNWAEVFESGFDTNKLFLKIQIPGGETTTWPHFVSRTLTTKEGT